MVEAKIGVIGGSGLYQIEGLSDVEEVALNTPFGEPSDVITLGTLQSVRVAFLPRHGRGHHISPAELPARANIYALKSLGVEHIISISAVGSLKEDIHPLDMVVPDQLIDRTGSRPNTFFGQGLVAHIGFADPFCPTLSRLLYETARKTRANVHQGGTCVVIEGPSFSTRAESFLYRSWGASVVGMTALPEARLAREAEICYATLAFVTDYDCWHQSQESVTVEMVIANLQRSVEIAKNTVKTAVSQIPKRRECQCATALKDAIITSPEHVPAYLKKDLALLIGKYVK
ncbi:MAG: methylthioadenosine phosphorylase [Chloroflexi bacterium RBG_13_53_26]|nr:MAG: methylthioadenosine phosphorylase [Chloroflexi bacterium RBG_13_53_26]